MASGSPTSRYHAIRLLTAEAERALVRATRVAEHSGDQELQFTAALAAGDWFQIKDYTRAARDFYAKAQALALKNSPDPLLVQPVLLLYPYPPLALRARDAAPSQPGRAVETEFTVRADGRVDGERVIVREAGKTAVDEVLNALRAARYRPRFENGRASIRRACAIGRSLGETRDSRLGTRQRGNADVLILNESRISNPESRHGVYSNAEYTSVRNSRRNRIGRRRHQLRHEDDDQFFARVDPEVRARHAAPGDSRPPCRA